MENQEEPQIIECITQSKHSPKADTGNQNFKLLYNEAGKMLNQFDNSINRCKKYNEAKINRKYQIIITQLETEVRKLNQKLKLEQEARSPTKKHISQILDKLVSYKDQNQQLKKHLQQAKIQISKLQEKIQSQTNALIKTQNTNPRATIERLPSITTSASIFQSVKSFLKDKQTVRAITNSQISNLQKFLSNNRSKMWNWTIGNLLQQLDKWSQGIKQRSEVDMWRIRSGIARKFSEYIDDSASLVAPSQMKYIKKSQSPTNLQASRNKYSLVQHMKDNKRSIQSSFT